MFLLAALLAAAWIWRIALVERLAHLLLPSVGLSDTTFDVERIDLEGARIARLSIPSMGLAADTIAATYDLGGLFGGRLGTVRLSGLTAKAQLGPDGLVLPGMPQGTSEGSGGLPALPADRILLDQFLLDLDTPQGPLTARGDAVLTAPVAGGVRAVMLATLTAPSDTEHGRLRAFADLRAEPAGSDGFDAEGTWSLGGRWSEVAGRAGGSLDLAMRGGAVQSLTADMAIADAVAADVASIGGSAAVSYRAGQLVADADLAIPAGWLQLRARPAGEGRADLRLAAQLDAGWLSGKVEGLPAMAGQAGISARGAVPLDTVALLDEGRLAGTLSLDLRSLSMPQVAAAEALAGRLAFDYAGGRLALTAEPGFRLADVDLEPEMRAAVPDQFRPAIAEPFSISGAERAPLRATVAVSPPGPAAIDLDARIEGAALSGALRGAAAIVPPGPDGEGAVFAPNLVLDVERAATTAGAASGMVRLEDLLLRRPEVRGGIFAELTLADARVAGLSAQRAAASVSGDFVLADGLLAFEPDAPVSVTGRAVDLGAARLPGETRLTFAVDPARPFRFDTVTDELEGALTLSPFDLALAGSPAGPVSGRIASGRISIDGGRLDADLAARLVLPDLGLTLSGIRLSAVGDADQSVRLDVDRIEVAGNPAPVVPTKLAARLRRRGERVSFDAEIFDPGRRMVVAGKGLHRLDTGMGEASFALKPLTFLPTVLQPADLFPGLAGRFSEVDGTIAGEGTFRWTPRGVTSAGALDVDARTVAVSGAVLSGVATKIRFDSLTPPRSAPRQELAVAGLDVGLPFTDGRIVFALEEGLRLVGRLETLSLFGGTIRTEPVTVDLVSPDVTVVLRVDGVDLQSFLSFAEYGDVQARGTLRGRLPVVLSRGRAAIHDGVLETEGPGSLSYVPAGADALGQANAGTEMLFQALRDFRYEQIRIEIDETPAQPMTLKVHLKGGSPNVYDGFPLELNINIGGALRDVLERGLKTYQLPAGVADRLGGTVQ